MTASMSRKGNCWDNAPTESFFNSLKNERVHGTTLRHASARREADLFEYIDVFYNRSRRHSTLGYQLADSVPAGLDQQHACSANKGGIRAARWKAKFDRHLTPGQRHPHGRQVKQ